jgi:anthranilate phosphoribosyltransferase
MDSHPFSWPLLFATLADRKDLGAGQVRWVMEEMMQGRAGDAEIGAFLIGMRVKGETGAEIAEAAQVLRAHMLRWDPGQPDVLDTCGTGGDGSATFNVSTATAFVVAGAGVPVVKHGNRSISSMSGSADALAALGVSLERACENARRSLDGKSWECPRF